VFQAPGARCGPNRPSPTRVTRQAEPVDRLELRDQAQLEDQGRVDRGGRVSLEPADQELVDQADLAQVQRGAAAKPLGQEGVTEAEAVARAVLPVQS